MTALDRQHESIHPESRTPISIRVANKADLKFIDDLQKMNAKGLGYWPRKQIQGYIEAGDVFIAEEVRSQKSEVSLSSLDARLRGHDVERSPLGYIIARDRYFKREDVGVIYQVAVAPGTRRSLIGAALVQHVFEQAAYGCKLFCCWCAQDLNACYFWEALGFVPLAFRTGSESNERIHIFWEKRIREGDYETPYWFPPLTSGGAIREGRLVIPIPPGTHWKDAKPLVLPGVPEFNDAQLTSDLNGRAPEKKRHQRKRKPKLTKEQQRISRSGGLWFEDDSTAAAEQKAKPRREERARRVYHPKYIAAARELCARYLEEVRAGRFLPEAGTEAKYDVCRQLEGQSMDNGPIKLPGHRLLDAA